MNITRQERKELDALSKDVFGASSRWQKLVGNGYEEAVTEEVDEVVPAEKEGDEPTTKKTKKLVPATTSGGTLYRTLYHTVESVREYMIQAKVQLESIRAQIKKQQEEAEQKKLELEQAKKIQDEVSGSAV